MKPERIALLSFIFITMLLSPAFPRVGQAAVPTLMLSSNARYSGLAEAGGAICYDAGAIHYNPAGLFFIDQAADVVMGGEFDFENLLSGILPRDLFHLNLIGYGRYKDWAAFAITNKHVSFGNNEWTNEMGQYIGTYTSFDNYTILTLASNLELPGANLWYGLGLNFKFIYSYSKRTDMLVGIEQDRVSAKSFAFDFGFLAREPFYNIFSFGIVLQNMGPDIVLFDENRADPIPFNLKLSFGATYTFWENLKGTLVFDLNKELVRRRDDAETIREYGEPQPHDPFWKAFFTAWDDESTSDELDEIIRSIGIEFLLAKHLALRFGWMTDRAGRRRELTFGIGADLRYVYGSLAIIAGIPGGSGHYSAEGSARHGQIQFTFGAKLPFMVTDKIRIASERMLKN